MEIKWIMIAFSVIMGSLAAAGAVSEYQKGQCRVEAIKANIDSEKIAKVCK